MRTVVYRILRWFGKIQSARFLAEGFALLIGIGTLLLWLPVSTNPGYRLSFLDALFTSTSAVCVTGLSVVPTSEAFTVFGKCVLGLLIQLGGMGVALFVFSMLLFAHSRGSFKARSILLLGQNLLDYVQIKKLAYRIIGIIFGVEGVGAVLSAMIFSQRYPFWQSIGYGIFHSISAFNNAGFDIFGGSDSMLSYAGNIPMNLVTCALVIIGGFGFIALEDLIIKRFVFRKLRLTTRIALIMTVSLLVFGTLWFWFFTDMDLLEAFFQSVIARTAGFATVPLSSVPTASLLVFTVLMFIGASPNSTGGGVKTNTVFCAGLKAFSSTMARDENSVFYRRIPELTTSRAFVIIWFGITTIVTSMILILLIQPQFSLMEVLVEVVSAFATVGSSMGITSLLNPLSKLIIIICMFIGRVGPVTIASLLLFRHEPNVEYTEENILIG